MRRLKLFFAICAGILLPCAVFSSTETYTGLEGLSVSPEFMDVSARTVTENPVCWSEAESVTLGSGADCEAVSDSDTFVLFGRYVRSSNLHSLYADSVGFMFIIK